MCVCAQLCLTLCDPMNCGLPGSSVHRIFQERILEQVAISFSKETGMARAYLIWLLQCGGQQGVVMGRMLHQGSLGKSSECHE